MECEKATPARVADLQAGVACAGAVDGFPFTRLEQFFDFLKGLRYGQVMAALAMSQHGDLVITTQDEIEALLDNDVGGIAR